MNAYDALADWFEILNDDCDYARWSQYFIQGLARLNAGREGLELGCGSGAFSRALTKSGYTMTGIDRSEAMLNRAFALAQKEGVRMQLVRADAASFRVPKPFDFLLSPNDCYNYLPPAKLPEAFRRAAAALKRGGIFWFDVSTPCKLRTKVANNIMADDRDDVTYLSFNTLFEDRVETDVTLFVRQGELFSRSDEHHTQYIHEEGAIVSALADAGFTLLSLEGHLGEEPKTSDRWNFICRR